MSSGVVHHVIAGMFLVLAGKKALEKNTRSSFHNAVRSGRRETELVYADYGKQTFLNHYGDVLGSVFPRDQTYEMLDEIKAKYTVRNALKLKKYIRQVAKEIPDFLQRFDIACKMIEKSIGTRAIAYSITIFPYEDAEYKQLDSICIMVNVKTLTIEECSKLEDKLVTDIAYYDRQILNYVTIQVIPDLK